MNWLELPTPAALVDEARMMHNIERMHNRINALGVRFRPHVKTGKCIEVARRQQAAGASGITVSTLKEAEQFFAAGFDDILYAVCIAPQKLHQALALRRRGCAVKLVLDSLGAASALVNKGREVEHGFEVLIEIDTDGHRSGVQPEDAQLIKIARLLHEGGAELLGVMTHAGSSYNCHTAEGLRAIAEQERRLCVRAAERLREAGLPCPVVSVGSTPTALSAVDLKGVTEVRAGVYVFFDLVMAGVGVCTTDEIALTVLTTVIGHQIEKGWVIVDAGWMAMSRDRGTQTQAVDQGYGLVCDVDGHVLDEYILTGANQEHGILARRDGRADPEIAARFPVGTQLRIFPNHACATGAQFPEYHAIMSDGSFKIWPRFYGW